MTQYYARFKNTNSPLPIDPCSHHYIHVTQVPLTKKIAVVAEGGESWHITYPLLEAFLDDWDELEREVEDKQTVAGLVGV